VVVAFCGRLPTPWTLPTVTLPSTPPFQTPSARPFATNSYVKSFPASSDASRIGACAGSPAPGGGSVGVPAFRSTFGLRTYATVPGTRNVVSSGWSVKLIIE
jgi:hypothetical protein